MSDLVFCESIGFRIHPITSERKSLKSISQVISFRPLECHNNNGYRNPECLIRWIQYY